MRKYKNKANMLPLKFQQHYQDTIKRKENNSFKKKGRRHLSYANIEMILLKMNKLDKLEYKMKLRKKSRKNLDRRHLCKKIILCVCLNPKNRKFGKSNSSKNMHAQIH
jgi:hypothetical protein